MKQIALQHPPLRHLNIISICETWKLGCFQNEFSLPSKGPLGVDGLRILRSFEAGVSVGSWIDLVTDSRGFFISK